jgi:hypothetical protein
MLLFLLPVAYLVTCKTVCIDTKICVYSVVRNNLVIFTVHSSAKGWAAFGTGSTMINSNIINGWKNSTGGYTVGAFKSTSQSLPMPTTEKLTILRSQVQPPPWAKIGTDSIINLSIFSSETRRFTQDSKLHLRNERISSTSNR